MQLSDNCYAIVGDRVGNYDIVQEKLRGEAFQLLITGDRPQQFMKLARPAQFHYQTIYREMLAFYKVQYLHVTPRLLFYYLSYPCYYCFEFCPYLLEDARQMGRFSLRAAAQMTLKVHKLLERLEEARIVHGDINAENIVLTERFEPLLVNFESACGENDSAAISFAQPTNLPPTAFFQGKSDATTSFYLVNLLISLHFEHPLFKGDEYACMKQFLQLFGRPDFRAFSAEQVKRFFKQPEENYCDCTDTFGESTASWPMTPTTGVIEAPSRYDYFEKRKGGLIEFVVGDKLGFLCRQAMAAGCLMGDPVWQILVALAAE